MNRQVTVLLPGDLRKRSGGFGYDRRIVAGLRERGWRVDVHALSARFPQPDARALADAEKQVAALPDGSLVVVDGLAGGAMPEVMQRHRNRLRWVALVHHPLALETGLSAAQRDALMASEQRSLAAVRHTIVTSASTARTLDAWGVAASRISVVEPGTDRPAQALAPGADSTPAAQHGASLLCVASVIPRKGHTVLIEALAGLANRDWTLHCAGDFTPDPDALQALHDAIVAHGLQRRVQLIGEVDDATLDILYRQADVFVLASLHEGFGMAAAEALAYGLPVFTTTAGALPDTVPAGAGVCVPPGDALALRAALARWFDDADWRDQLARGARTAGAQLADWPQACAQFAQVLDAVSQQAAGP